MGCPLNLVADYPIPIYHSYRVIFPQKTIADLLGLFEAWELANGFKNQSFCQWLPVGSFSWAEIVNLKWGDHKIIFGPVRPKINPEGSR